MVFFDTNSTTVSQQGAATVTEAANVAKSMPNARVTITGYTDTDGAPAYNQQLSVRRADAVKNALVSNGVAPQSINVTGAGEAGLLIDTRTRRRTRRTAAFRSSCSSHRPAREDLDARRSTACSDGRRALSSGEHVRQAPYCR